MDSFFFLLKYDLIYMGSAGNLHLLNMLKCLGLGFFVRMSLFGLRDFWKII